MQEKQEQKGLVWFGNDLRIQDNSVLEKANQECTQLIGIYCLSPSMVQRTNFGFKKLGAHRAKFLLETLSDLKSSLATKNISLLFFFDDDQNRVPEICKQYGIQKIYKQREWTSEEQSEVEGVQQRIPEIPIEEIYNQFLYHPEDILSDPQKIPNVFTAFRKKLEKYVDIRPEAESIPKYDATNLVAENNELPSLSDLGFEPLESDSRTAFPFEGGEQAALDRLQDYFFTTKKLGFYKKTRNGLLGKDYSSKFSPWLANGSISARTIYWQVKKFEREQYKNQSTYWLIFELIWRDYFKYVSIKYNNDIFKIGGILQKDYEWSREEQKIYRWIHGETQDDFVNANMLELKYTGWMSNRGRQNVASYFAKELLLDWRIGAAYFEEQLIDYDVHSNYGNWMYVSGVGNDPRDRKFNTQLQAERYDSNGKFRKLWLQETLF